MFLKIFQEIKERTSPQKRRDSGGRLKMQRKCHTLVRLSRKAPSILEEFNTSPTQLLPGQPTFGEKPTAMSCCCCNAVAKGSARYPLCFLKCTEREKLVELMKPKCSSRLPQTMACSLRATADQCRLRHRASFDRLQLQRVVSKPLIGDRSHSI